MCRLIILLTFFSINFCFASENIKSFELKEYLLEENIKGYETLGTPEFYYTVYEGSVDFNKLGKNNLDYVKKNNVNVLSDRVIGGFRIYINSGIWVIVSDLDPDTAIYIASCSMQYIKKVEVCSFKVSVRNKVYDFELGQSNFKYWKDVVEYLAKHSN